MEEYCVALHQNIENPLVNSVQVYSALTEVQAWTLLRETCKLTQVMREKIV